MTRERPNATEFIDGEFVQSVVLPEDRAISRRLAQQAEAERLKLAIQEAQKKHDLSVGFLKRRLNPIS